MISHCFHVIFIHFWDIFWTFFPYFRPLQPLKSSLDYFSCLITVYMHKKCKDEKKCLNVGVVRCAKKGGFLFLGVLYGNNGRLTSNLNWIHSKVSRMHNLAQKTFNLRNCIKRSKCKNAISAKCTKNNEILAYTGNFWIPLGIF